MFLREKTFVAKLAWKRYSVWGATSGCQKNGQTLAVTRRKSVASTASIHPVNILLATRARDVVIQAANL